MIINEALANELDEELSRTKAAYEFGANLEAIALGIEPAVYRAQMQAQEALIEKRRHELTMVRELRDGLDHIARAIQYQGHWHYGRGW